MRYKPGVGDIRESPALKILTLLSALGAELRYHDPHVPTLPDHGLSSAPLDEAIQDADLALIASPHTPASTTTRSSRAHASS
jgi:UDP-N-acetyl-D-glucosamine dehydrogenase